MSNPLTIACCLLALAASANAQSICYGENTGPNFEDFSSTGNATFAIEFTPNVSVNVNRVELFTGEVTAAMSLAIWTNDAVNETPLAALGQGSFTSALAKGWQGADLAPFVPLASGTTYWLVWSTVSGSQSPIDQPMANLGQPFRVSVDGGATYGPLLQSTERHFKFRMVCGCASPEAEYGAGCAGSGGFVPHLELATCPQAGANVTITLSQAKGGAQGLFFFGTAAAALPVNGTACKLLTAPLLPFFLSIPLSGSGPGTGGVVLGGTMPIEAAGFTFRAQTFVVDSGVPHGFATSNAIVIAVP